MLTPLSPFDIKCKKPSKKKKEGGGALAPDSLCLWQKLGDGWEWLMARLETVVVDRCYIELHLKCDRVPRSDSEMHRFRSEQ